MTMKNIALIGLAVATTVLAGCGNGNVPIVQNQQAISSAKSMRAYFDQSNGDFKALNPADQAAAEKLVNGDGAAVQKMFDYMKTSNKTPGRQ